MLNKLKFVLEGLTDDEYYTVNKFGRNTDIDTTTDPEDVWDAGGLYPDETAASVHGVTSASANDAAAGTGARTIRIEGLDANYNRIQEDVTLNGVTNVNTTNSYLRVFRAYVLTAGTVGTNDGAITIQHNTSTNTAAVISAGKGQTEMAIYTIPAGYTGFIVAIEASGNRPGATSGAMIDLSLVYRTGSVSRIKQTFGIAVDGTSHYARNYDLWKKVPEKTDVIVRVDNTTDNDADISASFDMVVMKGVY